MNRRHLVAALAVAWTPIVVATARALARGWIPVGDNAYFTIRARDVLTEHHPLVGAWSSGSSAVGVDVNNLGPLQLDLLAAPVRMFGFGPGTAIGVALVNLVAVAVVVVLTQRRLGILGAWVGAAMATATSWTLGSELLFEPRQHHALVLPMLAYLVAVWSVAAGERWAVPVAVALASLLAQTHLTFVLPALIVGIAAAVGALAAHRRERWRGPLLGGALVAIVAWAQPLVDELGGGEGNLSAVVEASGADTESYGVTRAAWAAANVLLPPDGWWRASFRAFDPAGEVGSTAGAVVALSILAVALGVAWASAHRRRDRPVATWVAMAAVAAVAGVTGAAVSPVSGSFGAVAGNFRFLWPIAVFVTFGLVVALARAAPEPARRWAPAVLGAVAVGLALAAVPTSYQSPGPERDVPLIPVARSVAAQVRDADVDGPVLVDRSGLFFAEPYSYVVVAALQEAGVDLRFDTTTDVARFGEGRAVDGPVTGTVSLVSGDEALEPRAGAELLARASWLDAAERGELAELVATKSPTAAEARRLAVLRDAATRGTVAVWFTPSG